MTSFLPILMMTLGVANGQDDGEGILLGSLSELNHLVTGQVYLMSEKVMEIRGFSYDGTAPATYFWVDTAPRPTGGGVIAPDGSPSLNCATTNTDPDLPAVTNVNHRVEFPGDTTINDYLGGSLSVWCEAFAANFGHLTFPSILTVPAANVPLECTAVEPVVPTDPPMLDIPPFIPTPEGYNCEELNPVDGAEGGAPLQVRWRVSADATMLELELIGMLPEGEYFSFGVSGSNERTEMIGADAQIADWVNGQPRVRDFYMDSRAQCSGVSGVCRDDAGGFTDDVLEVSGETDAESGVTVIRYKKPLTPTDAGQTTTGGAAVDQALSIAAGVETFIVWVSRCNLL